MRADRHTPGREPGVPRPPEIPHAPPPSRPGETPAQTGAGAPSPPRRAAGAVVSPRAAASPRYGGGEAPTATESPAEKPRATTGMQERLKPGRPLVYWIVLAGAAAGGMMIAGLMALAAVAAWREGAETYAVVALAAIAAFGLALPVVIVGVFLEKIWQMSLRESQDE